MSAIQQQPAYTRCYQPYPFYPQADPDWRRFDDDARRLVGERDFQQAFAGLVLTLVANEEDITAQTAQLVNQIKARLPQRSVSREALACVLLHGARWYTATFGRRYNWPYTATVALQRQLAAVLLGIVGMADHSQEALAAFRDGYLVACRRAYDPYPACAAICPHGSCLYRYHNRRLRGDPRMGRLFDEALGQYAAAGAWENLTFVEAAADQLVGQGASKEDRRSAGLCHGVQQLTYHPDLLETRRAPIISDLIAAF